MPAQRFDLPNPAERLGAVLENRYQLCRVLGAGGMGVVYEGLHLKLDRRVAIKVMNPPRPGKPLDVERFLREARSLARVHSAHVVSIQDLGTTEDGAPFLVMEYLEGCDLRQLIRSSGRLSAERTAALLADAAIGLQAVHDAGYVHRDVKPENLFVVRDANGFEQCKVLDFGVAKLMGDATVTGEGSVIGTVGYMAPEQIEREPLDARTDVFGLGVVLYECLTGQGPFKSSFAEETLRKTLRTQFAPVGEGAVVPVAFETIVERALARDPGVRFQCAADLARALTGAPVELSASSARAASEDSRRIDREATTGATPLSAAMFNNTGQSQTWRSKRRGFGWLMGGGAVAVTVSVLWALVVITRPHESTVQLGPGREVTPAIASVTAVGVASAAHTTVAVDLGLALASSKSAEEPVMRPAGLRQAPRLEEAPRGVRRKTLGASSDVRSAEEAREREPVQAPASAPPLVLGEPPLHLESNPYR